MILTIVLDAVFIVFIGVWLVFFGWLGLLAFAAATHTVRMAIQGLRGILVFHVFHGSRVWFHAPQPSFDAQFLRDVGIRL